MVRNAALIGPEDVRLDLDVELRDDQPAAEIILGRKGRILH
jgi:hypothetical protein